MSYSDFMALLLKEQLESAVRTRDVVLFKKLFRTYLSQQKDLSEALFEGADWLRRLGLYREAFLLISPDEWNFVFSPHHPSLRRRYFWSARLLNLMGASDYAVSILKKLKPVSAEENLIAANIFLSQYDSETAERFYRTYLGLKESHSHPYQRKVAILSLADCLMGRGKFEEAIKRIDSIKINSSEKVLRGMIEQARGEFLCRVGRFKEALAVLKIAETDFDSKDVTPDHGYLLKWKAVAEAKTNQIALAKSDFKEALRILRRPGIRPELWLDCLYQMHAVNLLPAEDQKILANYPGLPSFLSIRPSRVKAGFLIELRSPDAFLEVHLSRNEWILDQQPRLGIPKEVELIALLRRAGKDGIPLEKLKPLLWPDEMGSFLQLDNRIFQILKRVNHHLKLKTVIQDRQLILLDLKSVTVTDAGAVQHPSFFDVEGKGTAEAFAKYYEMGRSTALQVLSELVDDQILIREKQGRKVLYRINLSRNA